MSDWRGTLSPVHCLKHTRWRTPLGVLPYPTGRRDSITILDRMPNAASSVSRFHLIVIMSMRSRAIIHIPIIISNLTTRSKILPCQVASDWNVVWTFAGRHSPPIPDMYWRCWVIRPTVTTLFIVTRHFRMTMRPYVRDFLTWTTVSCESIGTIRMKNRRSVFK